MSKKENEFKKLRENLSDYGIRHEEDRELTDVEILEVSEMFCTGFTLLANKVQELSDEMIVIFAGLGSKFNEMGLIVDEKNRKAN